MKRDSGIAMPILFGVVLIMGFWIGSLSLTMSNSRSRFQKAVRNRKAYYLARSGLQHFFLKIKLTQRHLPEAMLVLENASKAEFPRLSSAFTEDVVLPFVTNDEFRGTYRISEFKIGVVDHMRAAMTMEVVSEGNYEGSLQTIQRVQRVSR